MKKRYLLTALALVVSVGVSVGFSSVQGSYALTDKKEALTPPTQYDYVYRPYSSGDPVWSFFSPSGSDLGEMFYTRSVNGSYYNYVSNYVTVDDLLYMKFAFYQPSSAFFGSTVDNWQPWYLYIGGYIGRSPSTVKQSFNFDNNSKYNYRIYFDAFSASQPYSNYYAYGVNINDNNAVNFLYPSGIRSFIVPPFSKIIFYSYSVDAKIDSIYIEQLDITQGMIDFASDNYEQGVVDTELNNVNWFNVIFIEGFGGVLSFIGNYEVLPGLKVFYIIGFTMVLAIVGFVAGQRKRE